MLKKILLGLFLAVVIYYFIPIIIKPQPAAVISATNALCNYDPDVESIVGIIALDSPFLLSANAIAKAICAEVKANPVTPSFKGIKISGHLSTQRFVVPK